MVATVTRKGFIPRWLMGAVTRWGTDPTVFDAAAAEGTLELVGKLFGPGRYFRLDVRGLERIPAAPVLLTSNHSGGTIVADAWGLVISWYRHFGFQRAIHPITHELVLSTETTGRFFATRGVLQAHPDIALAALKEHRRDVLVMPGGDQDSWRPFRDRYKLNFAGRTGYARLAIRAGVPIVPVAHAGAHHTLFVITDGKRIARFIGVKHLARADVWPIHLALPWGLTFGPMPHLPPPTTLRYRIGHPIPPPALPASGEPREEDVQALDRQVRSSIQGMLDDLAAGG